MRLRPTTIARDTWSVLSPVACAGCGRPDEVCCHRCAGELRPDPHHPSLAIRRALFDVPVIAGGHYRGTLRRIIAAYKERGQVGLARSLRPVLLAAWRELSREVSLDVTQVVCVPHSPSGFVRRGRHPTHQLVARTPLRPGELAPGDTLRFIASLPGFFPGESGQKNRTRRARLDSPPSLVAHPRVAGRRVVLIDDVVTTGITLEYAARQIERAGGSVVGCVVIAATPPIHSPRSI